MRYIVENHFGFGDKGSFRLSAARRRAAAPRANPYVESVSLSFRRPGMPNGFLLLALAPTAIAKGADAAIC